MISQLLVQHGGDASGAGAALPGQKVAWRDMEVDSIGTRFPTRELLADRCSDYSAVPGVRARDGLRWYHYGPHTSRKIQERTFVKIILRE